MLVAPSRPPEATKLRRQRARRGGEIDASGYRHAPAGLLIGAKERRCRRAQHRYDPIRSQRLKLTEQRTKVFRVFGNRLVGENLDIGPKRGLRHRVRIDVVERIVVADDRDAVDALALEPADEAERDVAVGRDRLEGIVVAADARGVDEILARRNVDDERHFRFPHNRHDRMRDGSPERAEQHRDVLLLDQSFRGGDPGRGVRGIVAVERFHRPAQHAAGLVDPLKRELDSILLTLPAVRVLSAEDRRDADADRLRREGRRESEDATGQQGDPEGHRLFLVKGAGPRQAVSFRILKQSMRTPVTRL